MILTTPTARATTKVLRYSLDQARVVAVATAAVMIVFAIATPPPAFPRVSSSVLPEIRRIPGGKGRIRISVNQRT